MPIDIPAGEVRAIAEPYDEPHGLYVYVESGSVVFNDSKPDAERGLGKLAQDGDRVEINKWDGRMFAYSSNGATVDTSEANFTFNLYPRERIAITDNMDRDLGEIYTPDAQGNVTPLPNAKMFDTVEYSATISDGSEKYLYVGGRTSFLLSWTNVTSDGTLDLYMSDDDSKDWPFDSVDTGNQSENFAQFPHFPNPKDIKLVSNGFAGDILMVAGGV